MQRLEAGARGVEWAVHEAQSVQRVIRAAQQLQHQRVAVAVPFDRQCAQSAAIAAATTGRERLHVSMTNWHLEHACQWPTINEYHDRLPGTGVRCLSLDFFSSRLRFIDATQGMHNILVPAARDGALERLQLWYWVVHGNPLVTSRDVRSITHSLSVLPRRCLQVVILDLPPCRDFRYRSRTPADMWGVCRNPFFASDADVTPEAFVTTHLDLVHQVRITLRSRIEIRIVPEDVYIRRRTGVPFGMSQWPESTQDWTEDARGVVFAALDRLWNTGVDGGVVPPPPPSVNIRHLAHCLAVFPSNLVDDEWITSDARDGSLRNIVLPLCRGNTAEIGDLHWVAALVTATRGHIPRFHTNDRWVATHIGTLISTSGEQTDWTRFASVLETINYLPFLTVEAKRTLLQLLGGYLMQHFPLPVVPCGEPFDPPTEEEIGADKEWMKSTRYRDLADWARSATLYDPLLL